MPLTVTAKQLSKRGRVPLRQIQNWTLTGVLLADEGSERPGRGASRQYPAAELDVAILLGAVSHQGMAVSEARALSESLRSIVRAADIVVSIPEAATIVECKTHAELRNGTARLAQRLKLSRQVQENLLAYACIEKAKKGQDAILILAKQGDQQWIIRTILAPRDLAGAETIFAEAFSGGYLLHLSRVFAPVPDRSALEPVRGERPSRSRRAKLQMR